jgi:hypothetical protein
MYPVVIKYNNIYNSKALQNFTQSGIFGLKINHLATLHVHGANRTHAASASGRVTRLSDLVALADGWTEPAPKLVGIKREPAMPRTTIRRASSPASRRQTEESGF